MTPYRDAPPDETRIRRRPNDHLSTAARLLKISFAIIPLNFCVFFATWTKAPILFEILAILQLVLGTLGLCFAIAHALQSRLPAGARLEAVLVGLGSAIVGAGGFVGYSISTFLQHFGSSGGWSGGAWGRPLRVRGRQLHPELRTGSDWTTGSRPSAKDLDEPTRTALAALWLHDAQKEHASVPAFSRVSWLLAAAGSPPELLEGAHRAALEEADHTRRCFALAAGYSGITHSVEPMPDLLLDGLSARDDVFELLAGESLDDGCLLEEFNADVAAECAKTCEEPVTRAVLEQIAVEERSHAELSWAILSWALRARGAALRPFLERRMAKLERVSRPTAVSSKLAPAVAKADANALRRHGRLPDERWAEIWQARLLSTRERARTLLTTTIPPIALASNA